MNILITVDESFIIPAKAMLYSLGKFHKQVTVYIIYHFFTDGVLEELQQFVEEKCGGRLVPIKAENYFKDAPLSSQYGKPELYFRLMAPYMLPKNLDRVLYMDADMIVQGSLKDFYEQEFDGAYAAFVKDRFDFCDEVVEQKRKLGLTEGDTYFNSGLILFNLKEFRQNIAFSDILSFITNHRDRLRYFDQDILNVMLKSHKKIGDERFNYQVYPFEELRPEDVRDKVVIHFTDRPKPWEDSYKGHLGKLFLDNTL